MFWQLYWIASASQWLRKFFVGTHAPHAAHECLWGRALVPARLVEVDGKVRTDTRYPAGFMDVISMPKAGDNFRLLYDTKGRFVLHRILEEEAKYKVCKVVKKATGHKKVPYIVTHDGRTIRYPDPLIKVNDSVKVSIETGKVMDDGLLKWDVGALCMIVKGRNAGRVGVITAKEKHLGSFDIVYVKDSTGHMFATRMTSVFIIGKAKPAVARPRKFQPVKILQNTFSDRTCCIGTAMTRILIRAQCSAVS